MSSKPAIRVWINPWKYFSATSKMSIEEAGRLEEQIGAEVETGNEEGLRRFDFVSLEDPYLAWKRLRQSNAS